MGDPEGYFNETNAAGWDVVDDIWEASQRLLAPAG